jgi:uncharacterized membrane protein
MSDLKSILIVVSALGSGLVGGIFFAFSNFVMKALARVPPAQGVAAMQSINVVALNRWFFAVFFGTAVCCLALAISLFARLARSKPLAILLSDPLALRVKSTARAGLKHRSRQTSRRFVCRMFAGTRRLAAC